MNNFYRSLVFFPRIFFAQLPASPCVHRVSLSNVSQRPNMTVVTTSLLYSGRTQSKYIFLCAKEKKTRPETDGAQMHRYYNLSSVRVHEKKNTDSLIQYTIFFLLPPPPPAISTAIGKIYINIMQIACKCLKYTTGMCIALNVRV